MVIQRQFDSHLSSEQKPQFIQSTVACTDCGEDVPENEGRHGVTVIDALKSSNMGVTFL